ncbi:PAS domain S-box protein [uncultured Arcobacter sp.]|uniref:PAS domain S-box protein n=1 Tax=uncultured Arcobacter sp. TaxID=165434 RepID=UPI0026052035|nr:PAS domain S-box protein [uncultured Arcobacter sp.]
MKDNKNNNGEIDFKYRKSILKTLIISTLLIFAAFVIIEKYFLENEFKKQILNSFGVSIIKKENELNKLIFDTENTLKYISNLKIFKEAVANNNLQELKTLFLTISQTNIYFMQLRFVDNQGKEQLRVDRSSLSVNPTNVTKNNLQDKSNRDYFIESKKMSDIYISNLDLNIENGHIEFPFRPTLRIILPVLQNDKFVGELIVNLEVNLFFDSTLFNVMICDSNGKVILPFDKEDKTYNSRLNSYFPDSFRDILIKKEHIGENYISNKFDTTIKNNVIIVSKLKEEYFKKFQNDQFKLRVFIFTSLMIFIAVVIFFVFKKINEIFYFHYKSKLEDKVKYSNHEYKLANSFLSKNIDPKLILSQASTSMILTDDKVNILYVNNSFTELFEYTQEEVLGKNPGFLRNEDLEQKGITILKNAIENDKSTTVVLRNYTKSNKLKYIELSISPIFDEKNDTIIYYLGIQKDVTKEQKILRELRRIF